MIVTSRRAEWEGSGATVNSLSELERFDSLRLLLEPRAERLGTTVETILNEDVQQRESATICSLVGDLPLALALAAAYLQNRATAPLNEYRVRLQQKITEEESLDQPLPLYTEYRRGVAGAIALSYEQLALADSTDTIAILLLRAASYCLPGTIPQSLILGAVERAPDIRMNAETSRRAFNRLADLGLLLISQDYNGDGNEAVVLIHILISDYVRRKPLPSSSSNSSGGGLRGIVQAWWRRVRLARYNDQRAIDETLIHEISTINDELLLQRGQKYLPHLFLAAFRPNKQPDVYQMRLREQLAQLSYGLGALEAATIASQSAAALAETLRGTLHLETIRLIMLHGDMLMRRGRYEDAGAMYFVALVRTDGPVGLGPDGRLLRARLLDRVGKLELTSGNAQGAHQIFMKALKLKETLIRAYNDPELVPTIKGLGAVLIEMGDYGRAQTYLFHALDCCDHHPTRLPADQAECTTLLATIEAELLDAGDAIILYERAVATNTNFFGSEHPRTITSIINLAAHLRKIGKLDDAIARLEQLLEISRRVLGDDHPEIARILILLAAIEVDQGNLDEGRQLVDEALRIQQRVESEYPEDADSLVVLAELLRERRSWMEARQALKKALRIQNHLYSRQNRRRAKTIDEIGLLLQACGKRQVARIRFEQSLKIREATLNNLHPDLLRSLLYLEAICCQLGNLQSTQDYLKRVYRGYQIRTTHYHPPTAFLLIKYIAVCRLLEEEPEGSLMTQFEQVREYSTDPQKIEASILITVNGVFNDLQGKFEDAQRSYGLALYLLKQSTSAEGSLQAIANQFSKKAE